MTIERAREMISQHGAEIAQAGQLGVIDSLKIELARSERDRWRAEYNYSQTMLNLAQSNYDRLTKAP